MFSGFLPFIYHLIVQLKGFNILQLFPCYTIPFSNPPHPRQGHFGCIASIVASLFGLGLVLFPLDRSLYFWVLSQQVIRGFDNLQLVACYIICGGFYSCLKFQFCNSFYRLMPCAYLCPLSFISILTQAVQQMSSFLAFIR